MFKMKMFLLGMATMYFVINFIILGILIITEWGSRKNWKIKKFPFMIFLGVPGVIAEIFF